MKNTDALGIVGKWSNTAAGHVLLVIAMLAFISSPLTITRGRTQIEPPSSRRPPVLGDELHIPGESQDPRSSVPVGDPISAGSGAYYFRTPLLDLGGLMDLGFELFYRSTDFQQLTIPTPEDLPFSFWWRPKVTGMLEVAGRTLLASFQLPDSSVVSFKKLGNDWVLSGPSDFGLEDNGSPVKFALKETSGFFYLMNPIAEEVYIFEKLGPGGTILRILRLLDRNNNQLTYAYAQPSDTNPSVIEDGLGRKLAITYQSGTLVVTDHVGRRVAVSGDGVIDALGQKTTFENQQNGVIVSVMRPRGNTPYSQEYPRRLTALNGQRSTRPVSQEDAFGNRTTLEYDADASKVTVEQPDGGIWRYQHFSNQGLLKSITDPAGNTAQFTQNSDRQLTSGTDRLGATTRFTYHAATGKLASLTNAKEGTLRLSYTAQDQPFMNPAAGKSARPAAEQVGFTFHNLSRIDYPDGTNKQFTYDSKGNLITYIDQARMTWRLTYSTRGQVLTITNPTRGVTTFTYNNDATLASRMDSDTGLTTYTYDTLKRLTRITAPDGSAVQIVLDEKDRVTSITDANNHTATFTYDANDNLIKITDAAGKETQYAYDQMDRINRVINRLGKVKSYGYDALERLASVTDATGIATTFGYDPRGWLKRLTRAGHTWQNGYDNEGMLTSFTTPLGNASRSQYDELGSLIGFTDSLGQSSTLTRDAMQRAITYTDPLRRISTYAYDPRDVLSAITTPEIGTVSYQHDVLGFLSRLTDLRGQNWDFTYTLMGRPQSRTDPLGRTWQSAYDMLGRPSQMTFPDSTTVRASYDAAGNLIRLEHGGGPNLRFTYDALDRLTAADGIQLTYDAEDRAINTQDQATNFGAIYDDAGRLKTATYNNGALTVAYTYDAASGLLTQVSDSLTGAKVTFMYDDDFRVTGITRSNGVNTALTWDKASRLVRIQDGRTEGPSLLDLQYMLDAAGQVTQANMTAPLDPARFLAGQANSLSYDRASQISSVAYAYDQRGRETAAPGFSFTWDGDSRLVGINDIALGYNGLNDLRSRREGGQSVHYFYDYAIYLGPIVAEQNEANGQFLRYYVWAPNGGLLYMIDAADGNKVYFYHFDRNGSTLALTNQGGAVTDAYAYEPYGQMLAHQGTSPQPFTFVGQGGIRQEGSAGTLYHIRARYYDATTGRFLSPDPIWPQVDEPLEINPYLYAHANPMGYVDANGAGPESSEVGFNIADNAEKIARHLAEYQEEVALREARYLKILADFEATALEIRQAPLVVWNRIEAGLEAGAGILHNLPPGVAPKAAQVLVEGAGKGLAFRGALGLLGDIGFAILPATLLFDVASDIEQGQGRFRARIEAERARDAAKAARLQREAEFQEFMRQLEEKRRQEEKDRQFDERLRQRREQVNKDIGEALRRLAGQREMAKKLYYRSLLGPNADKGQ